MAWSLWCIPNHLDMYGASAVTLAMFGMRFGSTKMRADMAELKAALATLMGELQGSTAIHQPYLAAAAEIAMQAACMPCPVPASVPRSHQQTMQPDTLDCCLQVSVMTSSRASASRVQ